MTTLRALYQTSIFVLATVVVLAGLGQTASAESVERRFATLAPSGSSWMKILEAGAADLDKETEGRVKTKYYPNGVQGDERDVVRKMRLGQLDGAALTSVGLSLIEPSIRVLELPRMFESVEELDYVRDKMWSYFRKKFAKKGFILANPGDVGFVYFYSKTAVKSVSDLRDAKIWVWGDDDIAREMFKELNVKGIPMGVPDVLSSLTTGRINAAYASALAAVALQWNTKVSYMTSMPLSYAIGASVITKDMWAKSSDADRKTVQRSLTAQSKKLVSTVRRDNQTARKQMIRKGVKVVETPPDMVRDFDDAAKRVWKGLVGKVYSQEELDMVMKYRDEYRAKKSKP
jgi:TRAP-type C4-dicarboxylate transport system substrate-binding protein